MHQSCPRLLAAPTSCFSCHPSLAYSGNWALLRSWHGASELYSEASVSRKRRSKSAGRADWGLAPHLYLIMHPLTLVEPGIGLFARTHI